MTVSQLPWYFRRCLRPADLSETVSAAALRAYLKAGTEVRAAFDAHITRFTPHNPSKDTDRIYGAQLHFALVEIIGDAPGGQYKGVDLCSTFLDMVQSGMVKAITFNQDGSPPTVN